MSSLCPSYQKEAALQSGGAIEKRIKEKITRNATVVAENMLNFLPLVVETLDGWNSSGLVLLEELSKRIAEYRFIEVKGAFRRLMTGLSCRTSECTNACREDADSSISSKMNHLLIYTTNFKK